MTSCIKIFALLFCIALLISCWSDFDCLHCKECFFEEDCASSPSGSSSSSSDVPATSSSSSSSSSLSSSSSQGSSSSLSSSSSQSSSSSSSSQGSSSNSMSHCGDLPYNAETQFCDERSKDVYGYATIGSTTWMTEDLKYSNCFLSSCGLLAPEYNSMYYEPNYAATICPYGWKLPSIDDFDTVVFDPDKHHFSLGGYYNGAQFVDRGNASSLYCIDSDVLKVIQIQESRVVRFNGTIIANNVNNENELHSIRCIKEN